MVMARAMQCACLALHCTCDLLAESIRRWPLALAVAGAGRFAQGPVRLQSQVVQLHGSQREGHVGDVVQCRFHLEHGQAGYGGECVGMQL